ncbi:hypothetical protein AB6A40_003513 [Gnathostoma spinigerum]|uniref:Uncharacterized protein n=1 Tax=Gnathostoma spinigerum TaxID=75299 RepID=A0ABD6EHI7_9BILA
MRPLPVSAIFLLSHISLASSSILHLAPSSVEYERTIMDLPPTMDQADAFNYITDPHKVKYIKSLFMKAFYEPACDGNKEMIIKPIYFWPGSRVDLPCKMCRRAFTVNGEMKHWWFMDTYYVEKELKNISNIKNSKDWAKDLSIYNAEYGWNSMKIIRRMPVMDKLFDAPKRPVTTYIQRNGYLSILQPTAWNEGIYRCLDAASLEIFGYAYYLIAMQPIFIYDTYVKGHIF